MLSLFLLTLFSHDGTLRGFCVRDAIDSTTKNVIQVDKILV